MAGHNPVGGCSWRHDLKPGDAIASSGHVVLFIDKLSNGRLQIWEAQRCIAGIVESSKNFVVAADGMESTTTGSSGRSTTWHAVRRLDLTEPVVCGPNTCSGHGTCNEGVCQCSEGFRTPPGASGEAQCGACAEGYAAYPSCERITQSCNQRGELRCGDSFRINPSADGTQSLSGYGGSCSGAGSGKEATYRFAPSGSGRVTVTLEGGGGLKVMRGACSPTVCIAEGTSSVDIDYGGDEAFFIAAESEGSSSELTVAVDCNTGGGEWIGDGCNSDSDCDDMTKSNGDAVTGGFCYRSQGADARGFCSVPCGSRGCSDRMDRAATFCVADPADTSKGMCVSKSDTNKNGNCSAVPGTAASRQAKFGATQTAEVCYPGSSSGCQSDTYGVIQDYSTGAAVPDARVEISGGGLRDAVVLTLDPGGSYHETGLACGSYTLTVSAVGYVMETVSVAVNSQWDTQVTRLRAIAAGTCQAQSSLTGTVFDGTTVDRALLPGAVVDLHRGVDTTEGEPVRSAVTNEDGTFSFLDLEPGNYTATTIVDGHTSAIANLISCSGAEVTPPVPGISVLPSVPGSVRIVLEWERPDDLDLHLQLPSGDEVHFYEPCRILGGAMLEVDRITSAGPEVITIDRFEPGLYTVFVHNYSAQRDGAEGFEISDARVMIQGADGQEIGRYVVPTSGGAFFWDVVSFQGSDPESLFPVQLMNGSRPNPYDEYTQECRP